VQVELEGKKGEGGQGERGEEEGEGDGESKEVRVLWIRENIIYLGKGNEDEQKYGGGGRV
jgi:hypothetical protein